MEGTWPDLRLARLLRLHQVFVQVEKLLGFGDCSQGRRKTCPFAHSQQRRPYKTSKVGWIRYTAGVLSHNEVFSASLEFPPGYSLKINYYNQGKRRHLNIASARWIETSKTTFYNDQPRNSFFKKTLFTKGDVGDFISPSSDDILCPLSEFGAHIPITIFTFSYCSSLMCIVSSHT